MRRCVPVLLAVGGVLGAARASGAEPVLTHCFPAGVARGAETEVKLVGKFDPWPCRVWASTEGVSFTPGKDAGVCVVSVAADARPGPCLIRACNGEGVSLPIAIVIDDAPQTTEAEPNNDPTAAQAVPAHGAIVNGRHEKSDDVDSFAVDLRQGQVLVARVEAYVLAAGYDPMLRIVDGAGRVLGFNHDHVTLDPFLAFTAPRDGRYVVQTMGHAYPASTDIRFAGGETCLYRLHLSTGPLVRNTWPLGVRQGSPVEVALEGWNLTETRARIDPANPPAGLPVVVSTIPELAESADAAPLIIPCAVSGRLESPGQSDTFKFSASKDTVLVFSVGGRRLGSEIDARLTIRGSDGKELASSDDEGGFYEPRLVWTAPSDGEYSVTVGDVTHRGGEAFYYRLSLEPAAPSLTGTSPAHAFKVAAGQAAQVKVTATPTHGYKAKVRLAAVGLPAGVTAAEVDVPEAGGEVTLSLVAEATAAASSGPLRLVLREVDGSREFPLTIALATTGENNGVPQGYQQLLVNSTDQLWLTVTAPPTPAASK